MSDVKPAGFVQKSKFERLVSGYNVVAALYKDQFADEVPIYSQKTITALQAEIEALRKDVERYKWLRSRMPGAAYRVEGIIYSDGGLGVDAGIDAAIAKEKQQESLK